MAGHMGDARVTTLNLQVVSTDEDEGLILVRGAVPGAKGGWVLIRDAVKRSQPEDLPFPAALKSAPPADEEAPAEEAAGEEAPAEETPVEDAPAEDATVDETPTEEAPAEDAAGEDEDKKEQ